MKEFITYTQLNIPYAAKDMFLAVIPMIISAILLQQTFQSQKRFKERIFIWIKTILLTYLILVILAAMQYAAYYDLYWEIINTNSILYAFFWIIDVVFQFCGILHGISFRLQDRRAVARRKTSCF